MTKIKVPKNLIRRADIWAAKHYPLQMPATQYMIADAFVVGYALGQAELKAKLKKK